MEITYQFPQMHIKVYLYTREYIHTYTYTQYIHIYICIYTYIYICIYIYAHTHKHMHIHTYTYTIYTHINTYIHISMHIHMYLYIYTHTHIHIRKHYICKLIIRKNMKKSLTSQFYQQVTSISLIQKRQIKKLKVKFHILHIYNYNHKNAKAIPHSSQKNIQK